MNPFDLQVLRALARLSRARRTVDCESIALRAGGSSEDVRASLARLSRASLAQLGDGTSPASPGRGLHQAQPRLTLAGLAVAVASGAAATVRPRARMAARRAA